MDMQNTSANTAERPVAVMPGAVEVGSERVVDDSMTQDAEQHMPLKREGLEDVQAEAEGTQGRRVKRGRLHTDGGETDGQ